MTVYELYKKLCEEYPCELSCEWDNDGLMCCPDAEREVKRVLVALDVTAAVAKRAIDEGYDLIVSHHPMIFRPLGAVAPGKPVADKTISLLLGGVSVMSFHTRLDAVEGGVNDKLCSLFGLCDVEVVMCDGSPVGRIGSLPQSMSAEDFAKQVKSTLGSPFVLLSDTGVAASRVALVGGGGGSFITAARDKGADTFVSGDIGYHALTDAPDFKSAPLNLIEVGHFYSEHPVCSVLADMVHSIAPELECDIYFSNVVKAI